MNLMNFIYDIANSDFLYYVLIILLIFISLAMLYLVYAQNREISKQLEQKKIDAMREQEKEPSEIEGSPFTELESLDGREQLLEISKQTIPQPLEYTQTLFSNSELEELQSITRELESGYKDKKTIIDDYEEEQEEAAIISYDELLSKTQAIPKIEEDTPKSENYKHEEDFLERLKNLNNSLK